jgi:hypothetical protein
VASTFHTLLSQSRSPCFEYIDVATKRTRIQLTLASPAVAATTATTATNYYNDTGQSAMVVKRCVYAAYNSVCPLGVACPDTHNGTLHTVLTLFSAAFTSA